MIMVNNEKLSSKEYWDEVLKKTKLPVMVSDKQYTAWIQNIFFEEILKQKQYKTLIEVGSGSSAWLPYLAKKYNLKVSGLDYSETGCRICEENLKLLGADYDEVVCEDIFAWESEKKYDVIISFGVIEHFDDPVKIIEIFARHLNPEGVMITVIPNLPGLAGKLTKWLLPEVYSYHKIITDKQLESYHKDNGLDTWKCKYTGMFYPMIIPWTSKTDGWLFKSGTYQRKTVLYVISVFNFVFTKVLLMFKIRLSSQLWSPFVIYAGKSTVNS